MLVLVQLQTCTCLVNRAAELHLDDDNQIILVCCCRLILDCRLIGGLSFCIRTWKTFDELIN